MDTFILIEIVVFLGVVGSMFGVLVFDTPLDKSTEASVDVIEGPGINVSDMSALQVKDEKLMSLLKSGTYIIIAAIIMYLLLIIFAL